jgi:2,4-dienoyl-CoA reductase-like NADH-dependent reductase (Old Yellow Enzyme family)
MDANTKPVDSQGRPKEIRDPQHIGPRLKEAFGGAYIANEGFTFDTAQRALAEGWADAVAFGKLFIANPDLVARFKSGAPLNPWDTETFYFGGERGYIDYPILAPVPESC